MASDITIVDNIVRAIPNMIKISEQLVKRDKSYLLEQIKNFDNKKNTHKSLQLIRRGI
jgi:4-phosphopantoate--beta-alanine ligase